MPRVPEFSTGRVQSPILTIESERLFADSAFGRRVAREIEAEREAITAENDRIAEELTAEEQSLTDRRASLPADDFQDLANAFDEKVQRLRREQDEKARAISTRTDEARRSFLANAQPVIEAIMRETGAALIIERRAVFISADVIDITDAAIARIDAAIGAGTTGEP
ncbi:OmpH family outer membrane protein [Thalassococcus sp. BH17M4-6]